MDRIKKDLLEKIKQAAKYTLVALLVTNTLITGFSLPQLQTAHGQPEMCSVAVDAVMVMDTSLSMAEGEVTSTCTYYTYEAPYCNPTIVEGISESECNTYPSCASNTPEYTPGTDSKLSDSKTAANDFLDNLGVEDQSALVSFSDTAQLNQSLSANHGATKTAVSNLSASGSTNIGDAIDEAISELSSDRANSQATQVVILLTDGKANRPNGNGSGEDPADVAYAQSKADEAAAANIKIFTIGLGEPGDVNATMLSYIASATGGEYHYAPDGADLSAIYSQISQQICEYGSISGCKYNDSDNDGDISGEETIADWEIVLIDSAKNVSTQLTDDDGCYTFAGLEDDVYTISETPQDGWTQTFPSTTNHVVRISDHNNEIDKDFANYLEPAGPICANGIIEEPEQCDGNFPQRCTTDSGYAGIQSCDDASAQASCTWNSCISNESCGDGIINGNEQCDTTNGVGEHQTCTDECALVDMTYCGDGIVQEPNDEGTAGPQDDGFEECDGTDGVGQGQFCSTECVLDDIPVDAVCGDGLVNQPSEQCDGIDGLGEHQTCTDECALVDLTYCGDGIVQEPNDENTGGPQDDGLEQCDGTDGVGEHQSCTNECLLVDLAYCGDGILNQETEQCDGTDGVGQGQLCTNECALEDIIVPPTPPSGGGGGGGGGPVGPGVNGTSASFQCTSSDITWVTSQAAVSWVVYGTDSENLDQEYKDDVEKVGHSVTLPDLQEGTVYYYQVKMENSNTVINDSLRSFQTKVNCELEPQVLGVQIEEVVCNDSWRQSGSSGPDVDVLGQTEWSDGSLLRGCAPDVYRIELQKKRHISSLTELADYIGQRIYNVTDQILNLF